MMSMSIDNAATEMICLQHSHSPRCLHFRADDLQLCIQIPYCQLQLLYTDPAVRANQKERIAKSRMQYDEMYTKLASLAIGKPLL